MSTSYLFIGGGNMGRALIGGLLSSGQSPASICVIDPLESAQQACREQFGVDTRSSLPDALDCDLIILATKPQQMGEVCRALSSCAPADVLFLSIAAGITLTRLQGWLGVMRPIVRAMPNTPALVGAGATALSANAHVDAAGRQVIDRLLSHVGSAVWLEDEAQLDAVTALSGSGPAYFFLLIELMTKAAEELGLPPELSGRLAVETAYGAACLARASDLPASTLREQVTSPGGTTERALQSFQQGGIERIVKNALNAAHARSIELARLVDD